MFISISITVATLSSTPNTHFSSFPCIPYCSIDSGAFHIPNAKTGSESHKDRILFSKNFCTFSFYTNLHNELVASRNYHGQTGTCRHSCNSPKVKNFYRAQFCIWLFEAHKQSSPSFRRNCRFQWRRNRTGKWNVTVHRRSPGTWFTNNLVSDYELPFMENRNLYPLLDTDAWTI